ncbi:MAG: hypothetical protein KIS96_12330 [Bauldia sp.]|nr:hypothetical protein [Bauldia sp.]
MGLPDRKCRRRSSIRAILVATAAAMAAPPTFAQVGADVPSEFLDFSRRSGDRIRFCINMASVTAPFDRAVAQAIADSVLLEPDIYEVTDLDPPRPLDYRFTLEEIELYIVVNNECDALMGYPLPQVGAVPDWLTVTRPYHLTGVAFVVGSRGRTLRDLPPGAAIGSRVGATETMLLRGFLDSAGSTWRWRAFSANDRLVEDAVDGVVAAAFVWEPALMLATGGDPAASGLALAEPPFPIPPVAFAVALPSNRMFLRSLIDPVIDALRADGTIDALAVEHGLSPAD